MDDLICIECSNIKEATYFDCVVCQRKMGFNKCNHCYKDKITVIDACSPKCKQILSGEAHIVPIYYNHETLMVIEDFDDYLGLQVVNHLLLERVLTNEQTEKLKKNCTEHKKQFGLLPYKCWSCKEVYTYEVECNECYNKNGYLCDECDLAING